MVGEQVSNDDLVSAFRKRQLSIVGTESPLQEHVEKLEAAESELKAAKERKESAAYALYEQMRSLGLAKWRYTASDGGRRVAEVKQTTKVVLRKAGADDVEAEDNAS